MIIYGFKMNKSITINTSHDRQSLLVILSDPKFVLPKLFPPIKEVEVENDSFNAHGRFMAMSFNMHGNVLRGTDLVYAFYLSAGGGKGQGKLTMRIKETEINLEFEYDGWMERMSGIFFMDRWFSSFARRLDEDVRMERIKRKI
ncbi:MULTISPECIES: DUF3211 domain-containing protein [Metallosphaera]|uniref:DUF3211 domain-containing protein n=1 Tax=Metallosphaera TaxID=41980 RepID=UPI001F05AAC1|nr:DUF3211 domain-containing protein [Metallosphaera sedula]MCH1772084.1 DUF3211 domain-containing protein [Metallosphaera sedula]MCP6729896.1 DUF3211 domain-containing protein [Metallosphaera sedula]BBL46568.1 hypothetical protein MJ1HA_0667 [Metallosphaera sedula]